MKSEYCFVDDVLFTFFYGLSTTDRLGPGQQQFYGAAGMPCGGLPKV